MEIRELSSYLHRLEGTSSRIKITQILAELFIAANSKEIDKITYLLLGKLAPNYKSIVFNLADRMMFRIIARAYGRPVEEVVKLYKTKGDLGIVAQDLATGKGNGLSVEDVYASLSVIAKEHGEESQDRKIEKSAKLFSELDPLSARYVARIPVGRLRLGFSDKTILDALSWMEKGDKSAKSMLDAAYQVLPDVGLLAKEVKEYGIKKAVKKVTPKVGVPVLAMLPQRLKSPVEMIKKMGKVAIEPKLDGLRIQIHFKRSGFANGNLNNGKGELDTVKTFTRNMNETSWMFPELNEMGKYIKADEVILDTEAVGVDEERRAMANFQSTMTRRRKHDIEKIAAKVRIQFYVFDILMKDKVGLMQKNYDERRNVMAETIADGSLFQMTKYFITQNPKDIVRLHVEYRKKGLEGIIIKRYDAAYVPGRTGWRWVKMKESEEAIGKLSDTVDCVVMGYTGGRGKRVSFGVGQFLVGVRDKDTYKTVTKVGTGLTDDKFRELKKRLSGLEAVEKPKEYEVNKLLEPDFWVIPSVVVEIAADDITKSPSHSSGLALRFPRLVKFRDDKSPGQATTVGEVEKLYELQKQ